MKRSLLTSVSVLALTAAASAADLPARPAPYKAPAAVLPDWTWTGFYLGINGGGVWHRAKTDVTDLVPITDFSTVNASSATFGAQAGYNLQYQSFVFGIEGDWNWVDASGTSNFTVFPVPPPFIGFESKLSSLATIRGRLGVTWSHTLFYATGGFAAGHVKNNVPWRQGGYPVDDEIKTGWTAGGGIEHMFDPHWTAKAEALYVDLGNATEQGFFGPGYVGNFSNTAVIARVGLNYKW